MSIIVTHINENGIVHAADSNLTGAGGAHAGTARKVFPIPTLDAGLTIAGRYSVGGVRMDQWLQGFINADVSPQLSDFADALRSRVEQDASLPEKQAGYIFHIAGYQDSPDGTHPELHVVTNFAMDPNGGYRVNTPTLRHSEDFWSRRGGRTLAQLFAGRAGQIYCNGFPSGRQVYFELLSRMAQFRAQAWNQPGWSFRPPITANEEAEVLKLDMEQVSLFFRHSNYSAPFIGGPIETLAISSR